MKNNSFGLLSDLLLPARINLNLRSNDRETVLVELVDQISELAKEPNARDILLRALQEREKLHSTGIGDGIALPHARNALVGMVNHPVVVFGRHSTGIAFGSLDSLPVRLFFLLVAPTVTQHLAILARLSRLLRDPRVVQNLLSAERPEKVVTVLKEAERLLYPKAGQS